MSMTRQDDVRLAVLLDAAPDGFIGVDGSGAIVFVNAQVEALFGYARDELIGEPVEALVPDAVRDIHRRHRAGYVEDPRSRPMGAGMQLSARRRDGTEFPADISLSAIRTDRELLVMAAVRDVSDRVALEAERARLQADAQRERYASRLAQSERLESLGQLAGGVAHDFNNILAVIINYATFVSDGVDRLTVAPGQPPEVKQEVLDDTGQVIRAAQRAAELTRKLLTFGRRDVTHPEVVSLDDVIREVEPMLRRTLGEHVELVAHRTPGLSPVMADPGQIEQVLVNLAVNARDAMPTGGTLVIETADVDVDADYAASRPPLRPGRYARLRVSDTGEGMAPEVLARAFEPFYSTKPAGEGTGLGLATVYGVISQAGGHAHLYSEPGIGTTFTALLPVTEAARPAEPAAAEPASPRGSGHILVVEDEDAVRDLTRRILTRHGYDVTVAASGPEALALVGEAGELDLLVTDVVMPQMLGREVAAAITEQRPGLPVLYMSGYAEPMMTASGTLDPGVELLEKPFAAADLLDRVHAAVDRAREQGGGAGRSG